MNMDEYIDLSYPDGYKKAIDSLDFVPDDYKEMLVDTLITMCLTY